MLEAYLVPIAIFIVLGLIAGLLLSVASKKLAVEVDERVGKVRECLPGANCGACGYAGCDEYAVALIEKNEKITPREACGEKYHFISEWKADFF